MKTSKKGLSAFLAFVMVAMLLCMLPGEVYAATQYIQVTASGVENPTEVVTADITIAIGTKFILQGTIKQNLPTYVVTLSSTDTIIAKNSTKKVTLRHQCYVTEDGSVAITGKGKDLSTRKTTTKEKIIAAGFPEEKLDSSCTGYYYFYFNFNTAGDIEGGQDFALLVQLKPATVDVSPITTILNTAPSIEIQENDYVDSQYYHSDDRYTGSITLSEFVADLKANEDIKADDEAIAVLNRPGFGQPDGFWKLYVDAYKLAETVVSNAKKDSQVLAAKTLLEKTAEKLIPITQANPTVLYETIQKYTTGTKGYYETNAERPDSDFSDGKAGYLLSEFTEITANVYRTALQEARSYLSGLFNEDGTPSANNTAANDASATYAEALNDAVSKLYREELYKKDKTFYYDNLEDAMRMLEQYAPETMKEADYTPASWAAYLAAYEKLQGAITYRGSGGSAADQIALNTFKSGYQELQQACRNLVTAVDVTVTATYVNNAAAREGAMWVLTARESVTLQAGSTTVQDLWDKLTPDILADDTWLMIYVNGSYYGTDRSAQLHNGDQVKLVQVQRPKASSESSTGLDSTAIGSYYTETESDYRSSLANISIDAPSSVTVGDKVSISGTVTRAADGAKLSPEGLTLFVAVPVSGMEENGVYNVLGKKTSSVTDVNGTLEYVFTEPGEYRVGLFHLGEDDLTFTDVYQVKTDGTYYSLYGGDFTNIKVTAGDEAALITRYRAENLAQAKEFFEPFHDYDFAEGYYEAAFKAKYDQLVANQNNADTFSGLMSVFETDFADLQALSANALDHETMIAGLRSDMMYIPSDLTELNYTHEPVIARIRAAYTGLNKYQRTLLTAVEIRDLDAMLAYAEEHPEYTDKKTILVSSSGSGEWIARSPGWTTSAPNYCKLFSVDADNKKNQTYYKYGTNGASPIFSDAEAHPGYEIQLRRLCKATDDYYQLVWSVDNGNTWSLPQYTETNPSLAGMSLYTFSYTIPMDYSEDTIAIQLKMLSRAEYEAYIINQDAGDLDSYKASALEVLQETYNSYDKSLYDAAGLAALDKALEDGKAAIASAATNDALTKARRAALAAMSIVRDKYTQSTESLYYDSGEIIGRVHVIVENTTFENGPFYGVGSITDDWYDLGKNDSMMTMLLKALEYEGYYWNSTRDSDLEDMYDYSITYISSIGSGDEVLGEFTGGQKSGWMGTLNDWFTNEGFAAFSVANGKLESGDEIHVMYTCDYGNDIHGRWNDSDTSLKALEITGGTLSPAFDSNTLTYRLTIPGDRINITVTPTASNKNYLVKTFLNTYNSDTAFYKRTESIGVQPGDTIYVGVGERSWPSMNKQGSEATDYTGTKYTMQVYKSGKNSVQSQIDALPDAGKITMSNYKSYQVTVTDIRKAYDALEDKSGVTITGLTAAEDKIAFFSEIDKVKSQLAALPENSRTSDAQVKEAQTAIEAADRAYKALTDEQKGYIIINDISNYNELVNRLTELTKTTAVPITMPKNQKIASKVIDAISKIGTVTENSGSKIEAAREAYDALTDAQKKWVVNYNELVEAEAAFAALAVKMPFIDVNNHWAEEAIRFVYENDLMKGISSTQFAPEGTTTRGMLVTLLHRMEKEAAPVAVEAFDDVASGMWYTDAVSWATENNIVTGYDEHTFAPDDVVTREQMAVILYRYAQFKGYDMTLGNNANMSSYADAGKIDSWAFDAMQWAIGAELLQGGSDGSLAPLAETNRAQIATIFMRFFETIVK